MPKHDGKKSTGPKTPWQQREQTVPGPQGRVGSGRGGKRWRAGRHLTMTALVCRAQSAGEALAAARAQSHLCARGAVGACSEGCPGTVSQRHWPGADAAPGCCCVCALAPSCHGNNKHFPVPPFSFRMGYKNICQDTILAHCEEQWFCDYDPPPPLGHRGLLMLVD